MLKYFKHLNPSSFFIVVAVFFQLLLNVVTPPLQAPDEFSHFYRAYQIAEGHWLPEKTDQRLGGNIPRGLIDFSNQHRNSAYNMEYTLDHREIMNSGKIRLHENERQFQDFANTSYYSPVSYLPQALSLFVLKKLSSRVGVLYYGTRLFTFLVWLLCMFFVIRTVPVFKWLITLLILLPMHPYITNSFSADTVTNILSFLFMSIVLKHVFVSEKIRFHDILLLLIIVGLLVLAKVVYIGIIIMLLLIPRGKFSSRLHRFSVLAVIFVFSLSLVVAWSGTIMQFYIPIKDYNPAFKDVASLSPCGDYYAQKDYILHHGFYFFKVIFNSLFSHPRTYLSGYIGVFGNGDIGMPMWIYILSYAFIFVAALTEKNEFSFTKLQKLVLIGAALVAYVLLLLSQHLIWDCVGEGIVDLVQGRYLIPLFPLLFMVLENRIPAIKYNLAGVTVMFVLFLNFYACALIYQRFFIGQAADKREFYCNAEEVDKYGAFKTSDPHVFLNNGNCIRNAMHRSGLHSALISPASPFCFTYRFGDVKPGDLIEIEAWEKGTGALLVIAGSQKNCGEFYFAGTYNSYQDDAGWQRIKNAYQVKPDCDSLKIEIYVWNPGKTDIYIDDLKVRITKFKSLK
ncbi:MAG: DUF2142 domain-containing protein [Bacteroidota bacterium]